MSKFGKNLSLGIAVLTIIATTAHFSFANRSDNPIYAAHAANPFFTNAGPGFTVTYDGAGNTHGIAPVDFASPYGSGSTVTLLGPGLLNQTGFRFAGWIINGSTLQQPGFSFPIASNILAEALWEPFTGHAMVDTFADGNFTADLVWSGSTGDWIVVADSDAAAGTVGSNTLRLSSSGTTKFLSSPIAQWGTAQEWGFFVGRRGSSFTATTQQIFWLYANESTLTSATVDGYRIAIGDDTGNDEIRLEHVVNGGVSSTVITSSGAITNGRTDIGFLVRVTRQAGGGWALFTSPLPTANGTGAVATGLPNAANTGVFQGSGSNNSILPAAGGFLGVAAQGTTQAEFDQIFMTPTPFAAPATRLVAVGGTDTGDCISAACGTIKYAISQASHGDTVSIAAGTYPETNIIVDKTLTFAGAGAASTIVSRSGGPLARIFDIGPNNPSINVIISGVTIRNGRLAGTFPTVLAEGAGIRNFAELTVTASTISSNRLDNFGSGAGILTTGNLTVNGCTLSGNIAQSEGGGIKVQGDGQLSMNSSTVSGNTSDNGGGINISTNGAATITNSTITNNSSLAGAGARVSAAVFVGNTIIAANIGADVFDPAGSIVSNGYNLIGSGGDSTFINIGDQVGVAVPMLGPLASNGGQTFTHALLFGSPAIDKGSAFGATTDQRGVGFVRTFNDPAIANTDDGTDIGAFEVEAQKIRKNIESKIAVTGKGPCG